MVTMGDGAGDKKFGASAGAKVDSAIENTEEDEQASKNPSKNIGIIKVNKTERNIKNSINGKKKEGEGGFNAKNEKHGKI